MRMPGVEILREKLFDRHYLVVSIVSLMACLLPRVKSANLKPQSQPLLTGWGILTETLLVSGKRYTGSAQSLGQF